MSLDPFIVIIAIIGLGIWAYLINTAKPEDSEWADKIECISDEKEPDQREF